MLRAVMLGLLCSAMWAQDGHPEKDGQTPKDLSGVRANRSFTVNGNMTSNPTYDRIFGGGTDNNCNLSVTFSGSGVGVQYAVVEFYSPNGGLWDGVEVNAGGTDIADTTMTLYCNPFDPANADLNVVVYDDDGGSGLLSSITSADGVMLQPNTSYFLVLSLFDPGDIGGGNYQLDFAGDVEMGTPILIPTMSEWGLILFVTLLAGISVVMMRKRRTV